MTHWKIEQLQQLLCATDLPGLFEPVPALVEQLGFSYYSFAFEHLEYKFNQSNLPARWLDHYQRSHYETVDPVITASLNSNFPLWWSPALFADAPTLWADAQAHDLGHGWTQPCHDGKAHSRLSVLRGETPVSRDELYAKADQILWLGAVLHYGAAACGSPGQQIKINPTSAGT